MEPEELADAIKRLTAGVVERIERTTSGTSRQAARLRASGRHVRRGPLLHGPPGVGKTLTRCISRRRCPTARSSS